MEDWRRLGAYVAGARVAAGYRTQAALAAVTPHVSERTLNKLETGHRVSPATLAVVEKAVGWKEGSALAILAGGEPAVTEPDPLLARLAALPDGPLRASVLRLLDAALTYAEDQRQDRDANPPDGAARSG